MGDTIRWRWVNPSESPYPILHGFNISPLTNFIGCNVRLIMPRLHAIFDTNAYVGLSSEKLESISKREIAMDICALASSWPCLELLARSAGPDAHRAYRAREALIKLWKHAGYPTATGPRLRVQEAGEVMLCRGLFLYTPQEPLLEIGFVADLVASAVSRPFDEFLELNKVQLDEIRKRVRLEEDGFKFLPEGLRKPLKMGAPGSEERHVALALAAAGLVEVLGDKYGLDLAKLDSGGAVRRLTANFPVALTFMLDLLSDATGTGRMPGGGNSAWDLKLAFHASLGASFNGVPAIVVSDDGRLLRAAVAAGDPARVLTPEAYLAALTGPDGFEPLIAGLGTWRASSAQGPPGR